jgi:hypothetical protein
MIQAAVVPIPHRDARRSRGVINRRALSVPTRKSRRRADDDLVRLPQGGIDAICIVCTNGYLLARYSINNCPATNITAANATASIALAN